MSEAQGIEIRSWKELLVSIEKEELSAEWKVRSRIGPEWVGSRREIVFYIGDQSLGKCSLHEELKKRLICVVGIPESSENEVIDGEADFELSGSTIQVDYLWTKAAPYEDPSFSQKGNDVFWN